MPILTSITEIIKDFKSLYAFGGCCLKLRDFCMDFEPYFKVHSLVSVHPKSIILYVWWCQFSDLLKFETCPSSLLNFRTANWLPVAFLSFAFPFGFCTLLHTGFLYIQFTETSTVCLISLFASFKYIFWSLISLLQSCQEKN